MDPEDDFLTWSFILTTSFESGEYTQLLPSFTALITDILSTSKLHGILEEHTDYFLTSTLPDTVRAVLNLGYLSSSSEIDLCTTFLVSVLPLISWAAVNDNFTLTSILLPILDIKSNIYSKNQTYRNCKPYEDVVKNYLSADTTLALVNFIKENSPKSEEDDQIQNENSDTENNENEAKPLNTTKEQSNEISKNDNNNKLKIQHFDVLFCSYCLIEESEIINISDISILVDVSPCFIQYLNSFQTDDRLRELDTTLLNRSFQSLMTVLIIYPSQPTNAKIFKPLFEIASRFVESEMLEKQIIGASVLSKAAESDKSKVKNAFQSFISTTTLADFLINRDIHAKLLEALDPVLSKIITPKHLESFWEKAEQARSSERSTILSIIASSLKKFDENVTLNFIDRITTAEKISPELLEFLANVSKSFTSVNIELSLHIIDTLIEYGEKLPIEDNTNGVVTALAIFAPYSADSQCQKRIIKTCSERIISNPSKQKFYIQVLKNMVAQTYQSRNDFSQDFLSVLINAISNPGFEQYQNRSDLYELLTLLVTKKKYSIDINMFETLISFRVDDLLWKFLTEIITKLGTDAYDSKVKNEIYLTAKNIDFKNNSSLAFVQFLQQYILIWNLKNGYVKSEYYNNNYYYSYETKTIPNSYVIHLFPLEKIGLLFKVIYFAKDDNVATEAESKVLLFISKTKDITTKKVIDSLIGYFNKTSNAIANRNKNKNKKENKNNKPLPNEIIFTPAFKPQKITKSLIISSEGIKESTEENKESTEENKESTEENKESAEVNKESTEVNKESTEENKESTEENKESAELNKESTEENKESAELNKESTEENKESAEVNKESTEVNKESTEENKESTGENKESTEENKETSEQKREDENSNQDQNEEKAESECDEYISKARILKLILQYIDEDEKNCIIEDYGVSRHKERSEILKKRHNASDEIKLNISYGSKSFQITAYRFSTTEDLKKRISRVLETSNFILYHDNTSLIQYQTLYQANVKDGSNIFCRQYQTYDTAGQKMPTIILHEKNFSKQMLEILSKNEPINKTKECIKSLDDLQNIAFTILKRLPSDQNIVDELDNIELFILNLSNSISNTCLFLYRAQILLSNIEKNPLISTLFVEHGGAKLLTEYLLSHEPPFHGLTLILKIFVHIFNRKTLISLTSDNESFDIKEYDEKLILYILNLFNLYEKNLAIKKSLIPAIKILNEFLINDKKRVSAIIYRYPQLLDKMIDNAQINDNSMYVPFHLFITYLDDKVQLFHLCVSKFNKNISNDSFDNNYSIDQNVINIIQSTIPYVHNLEDIKIVLDNCWKMILRYENTANIISYNSSSDKVLPVPPGYEEEIESDNKDKGLCYVTHISGNQTSQLSGVCQIIYTILTQEDQLKEEEIKNTSHILDILKIAVSIDVDEVQENLFRLFGLFMSSTIDREQYDLIIQNFRNAICEIHTDRWNYKPSTFAKSQTGFTGLRNLGSTCYMNSIFQQLFFTFPFTYLIILSDMKAPLPPTNQNDTAKNKNNTQNEGHQKLKELFTQLLLTKRRSCDTQPFCSSWKGWGKRLINPREQQDANEFLQLLLDQLPSQLNTPFKGEIKNIIEGVSESFESFNIEQFYTICLEIKDHKDVEASFESFIKSEPLRGESQYCISQDHKIDAMKYERIKTAPDILVLQLKRFEYNLTNFERIKINDRYEFPDKLNIARYMDKENESNSISNNPTNSRDINNNTNSADDITTPSTSININNSSKYDYELAGVVVHSGNAEGGHYYSIIKINQKWIKFNDIEVTEITQEEFETETYGGQQTNKTNTAYADDFEDSTGASAYLLFYRRINAIYEADLPIYLFDQCKSKQEVKVEQEEANKNESETKKENEIIEIKDENEKVETTNENETKNANENDKIETVHVKLSYDHTFDLTYLCDKDIVKSTEEDNKEIAQLQAIFGLPIFNFMINSHQINDLHCLVSYFFNIFCHSSFNQQATSMQFRLINFIKTKEDWEFCIEYIKNNFKKLIEPIYINCSITEIMECTSQFIISIIANVDPSMSFPFVEELMPTLVYVLNASWRQVPYVSELMKNFVIQGREHVQIALENNWINKFLDFITLVYDPTQQNELVSLLSPSATPTSSTSSLNYTTGNGSSSNLVQQITRSNVVIQNINLSHVFLILDALFDAHPSQDFTKIIKYSNSIVQSPSHSDFYINLLKKMSERDVIDIDVFINAITTNKKEIDNDIVFSTILNVLLSTEDPDRVESLINKVCPHANATLVSASSSNSAYGSNASTSLTTAFTKRILTLVKKKNKEVINFLLKFPRQTIFRFLIDNDKFARAYGQKIVMNIFDNVSRLSDKDREKIINKNNADYFDDPDTPHINTKSISIVSKGDSSDDNDQFNVTINNRKDELSEDDKEEMNKLYYEMITFIFDLGEVDISQYYEKEEKYMTQDSYHFTFFINVFEWLIIRLNLYNDESSFNAVQMLYAQFASMQNRTDYNMMNCLRIIGLFSVDKQQSIFKEDYEALFVKWNNVNNYEIVQMFNLFSDYLILHCRPQDAMVVFKHPLIRTVQKELHNASTENDFIAFHTYNTLIKKFIDNDEPIENEQFTLKQVIFMNTKYMFKGELSSIDALWKPQYRELTCLCFKYMTVPTRKRLMKECSKTLNLKKYQYSTYVYEYSDNGKKFYEACCLIDYILKHKEILKHEIVPVQKDKYFDNISYKFDLSEGELQVNFDRNNDEDDPYEDDENKNRNRSRPRNIINNDMNSFYNNPTTIINSALNYNEENEFDEVQEQNGSFFPMQIAGDFDEQGNSINIVTEKLFIKWDRFITNYMLLDDENQIIFGSYIFTLINKAEIRDALEKMISLQNQIKDLQTQLSNHNKSIPQKEPKEQKEEFDTDSDDDDYFDGYRYRFISVQHQLQSQINQKTRELENNSGGPQLSLMIFEELQKLYKQNPASDQSSKVAVIMTELIFNIIDYRAMRCKILHKKQVDNEKADHLVKLNNLFYNSSQNLLILFYETLYNHYMNVHTRNPQQNRNEDESENDPDQIDLSPKEVDDWSTYFVEKTICKFHYNKYSSYLYSKVLSKMETEKVVELFKSFCSSKKFYTKVTGGYSNLNSNYYDSSSSDDDRIYNTYNTKEIRPDEEEFYMALIFFQSKPLQRENFLKIFPFRFSKITNKEFYRGKSYIQELYGDEINESEQNHSTDDSDNENPQTNIFQTHFVNQHDNDSDSDNDNDNNNNNDSDDDDKVTKGTVDGFSSSENELNTDNSKDDDKVAKGTVEGFTSSEYELTPGSSKDDYDPPI